MFGTPGRARSGRLPAISMLENNPSNTCRVRLKRDSPSNLRVALSFPILELVPPASMTPVTSEGLRVCIFCIVETVLHGTPRINKGIHVPKCADGLSLSDTWCHAWNRMSVRARGGSGPSSAHIMSQCSVKCVEACQAACSFSFCWMGRFLTFPSVLGPTCPCVLSPAFSSEPPGLLASAPVFQQRLPFH